MTEELFREDSYLKSCKAKVLSAGPEGVVLDRTVFYPTGGGQPGDSGTMKSAAGDVAIADTVKGEGGILHVLEEGAALPAAGDEVEVTLDWDRRYLHMRTHTALHLLCSVVDGGVTGGQIGAGKGRLDFDIPGERPEKEALTEALNAVIAGDHPVSLSWITDAELEANPDLVRTMSVKPPMGSGKVRMVKIGDVDYQPCGGTHVRSTAEIGRIQVGKIENKGKQNRRINISLVD
ncbi:MAG: alanyl-tRNA editing protein [Nisaea sp.]|uniref:alanyl-tRNA editing protein n=1 Tax=Nisaea sp. TaxID=2024842 RepID=UPI001B23A744|nr:alanyl-tRNA editing protein [Nisaea sp.]MBO6559280.1 alanyl-tRNA editing protein [Nisaea sp.]